MEPSTGGTRNGMRRLAGRLRSLETLGVRASQGARASRYVLLANRLSLSNLFITWPFWFLLKAGGMDILAWAVLPILAWHASTLALNARGWTKAARVSLSLNTVVSISVLSAALGPRAAPAHLYLAAAVTSLILFDVAEERAYMAAGLAVNAGLFLAQPLLGAFMTPWYALAPEAERLLRGAFSLATLAGVVAGMLHYLIGNARVEKALEDAREKALSADRFKSRFIANMSHEIRTPLNVIVGLAQLMENPGPESKRREFLAYIRSAAADLLAILDGILDLSKIEAGRIRLASAPFRLRELAERTLAPFRIQAAQLGLGLRLDMDAEDIGPLRGDPLRLRQILNNLLSNAIKFTSEGEIILRIRRSGGEPDRPVLRFDIVDTGLGITAEAQRHLFQPFRQAENGPNRAFGGTGLGLAICKGLAELMGGSIGLASRPGAGTTVSFTAAFARDDAAEGTGSAAGPSAAEPERPAAGAPGNIRVLIVEDHPLNRMVLQGMLNVNGFRAEEVPDGMQALARHGAEPYDLIFMDCHMPVLDGIECTRRLRTLGPPRPVIVGITADALPETRVRCLEAGMDQVILKPVEAADLRRILARWMPRAAGSSPGTLPETEASLWVDVARVDRLVRETRLRDPEYRKRAFAQFRLDADGLRRALREAGLAGEIGKLKDCAHGLKGLCLTMGLGPLADLCKRIESDSVAGPSPDWSSVPAGFDTAFEASLADLERALGL